MAGIVVGHPFDTTKVQLQTRQASSPYKNIFEALKSISHQGLVRKNKRKSSYKQQK